jgi:predicted RND superfamily exporter protein
VAIAIGIALSILLALMVLQSPLVWLMARWRRIETDSKQSRDDGA